MLTSRIHSLFAAGPGVPDARIAALAGGSACRGPCICYPVRMIRPRKQIRRRTAPAPAAIRDGRQLAAQLKLARQRLGLPQSRLAESIGTKKTAISRLENHVGNLRLSTLRKLAAALGLRLEIKLT